MDLNPSLANEDFYEKYPTYSSLVSSIEIPKGLKAFEVVCPKRKFTREGEATKNNYELSESILSTVTTLGENDLYSDFNCLICFSILQRTMVVKDCLHRFCGECIEKCVRIGLRECPQCRLHIASRRSLRNDSIMDTLTFRLFPEANEFEKKHQEILISNNIKQFKNILDYQKEPVDSKSEDQEPITDSDSKDFEIIGVLLKPIEGNAEQFRLKSNILTFNLRLPIHVKVNYLKLFLLGKLRKERPNSKLEVQFQSVENYKNPEEILNLFEKDTSIGELAKKDQGKQEYKDIISILFKIIRTD
ncbi:RING finger containing protein [Cryptosporidium ubiquitum]|uniref:RING finger containing protein n=1 Tax=Cryptosporidium ubiquitum TaxID=857276 RepID=A0A1J4MH98_9CRYT|nr:RING finger containing protein [Cryptosporidium ubiquitum]OII73617.1 RING finger containing protein [Cryptosporidium ubiquitum]